jgi:hypothetical protein
MLRIWGDDKSRQKSDAPTGQIKAIAGGAFQSLALRPDGTPVLWGLQPNVHGGPVGPGAIPAMIAAEKFHSITIGRDDAVLLHPDGGLRTFGQYLTSGPAGAYRAATVGSAFAVAIDHQGTLSVWGPGSAHFGLANAPNGDKFVAVNAQVQYSLALHQNGTLFGWGNGAAVGPDIFAGWTPAAPGPHMFYVPNETFTTIAAGNAHAIVIRPDGTVIGWGDDSGGAIQAPAQVRFKAVEAGWGYSIGLSADGTLWGWGKPFVIPGVTDVWTFASEGWARDGSSDHYYVPAQYFRSIAAGAFHIMAITA